ncbi:hypothetical protein CONLIGDRAFT_636787 [Coniochaeta ligniaria NRRL 30616]|uniref:UBC core domain-containing protein n=1 Tax=Coniochaeta ligniaria NRRL 30616 TaxID=1408157 RepID=A0A1J7IBH1_9PEZI|nr:hypothetical protein CONLIGDRAFT_636787 [Coniochaeta ligniaria NRRL 30616]
MYLDVAVSSVHSSSCLSVKSRFPDCPETSFHFTRDRNFTRATVPLNWCSLLRFSSFPVLSLLPTRPSFASIDKMGSIIATTALRQRLLRDIAEMQEQPYPNIRLHVHEDDLSTACLVLTPENWKPLHLTVKFGPDYPLRAPAITIETGIYHPNVLGHYICASILNTEEGYTPAYTLKGIAIQLLSFFSSDAIEQDYGGVMTLDMFRSASQDRKRDEERYQCAKCWFGYGSSPRKTFVAPVSFPLTTTTGVPAGSASTVLDAAQHITHIQKLPDEVLLMILQKLEFEELTLLAQAWPRIGTMITGYDLIRTRELQCFVVKKDYRKVNLGIGVSVVMNGRQGTIQSEFDLISREAVYELDVRRSIHGITFQTWLPLPISYVHWRQVQQRVPASLTSIASAAKCSDPGLALYGFMNDIVVRLNLDIENRIKSYHDRLEARRSSKSTLRHASEKAIESYFHLFHLLLCLATSPAGQGMVPAATKMINSFMAGKTSKADVPNLGYLLVALLISDVEVTESLMRAIIGEAITRNVVWLLDKKGAGMAELAYLESDEISEYRLKKTFEGSRTSYRLLMFSELFRRTARPRAHPSEQGLLDTSAASSAPQSRPPCPRSSSGGKISLLQLRNELFDRHGAPPPGAAAQLASEVRRLQKIEDFPSFLREMGIAAIPSMSTFTEVLRSTVKTSHERGYSKAALSQPDALALRLDCDTTLDRDLAQNQIDGWGMPRLPEAATVRRCMVQQKVTFFPGRVFSWWRTG